MKKRALSVALIGMLIWILGGCSSGKKEVEALVAPLESPQGVKYTTTIAETGDMVLSTKLNGRFVPIKQEYLGFGNSSGVLKEKNVHNGKIVKTGDVLMVLESEDLEFQIKQQEIALRRAQLAYENVVTADGADSYGARMARLSLNEAQLTLEHSKEQKEALTIYAPFDGIVSYVDSTPSGGNVAAGTTMICMYDPTVIMVQCTGADAAKMTAGSEAIIIYSQKEYKGKVVMTTADKPEDAVLRDEFILVEVLDEMPQANEDLFGKNTTVQILKDKKTNVVIVPKSTITTYNKETYVYVLRDGNRIECPVVTGIEEGKLVEIIEGLDAGEEVIVR